MVIDMEKPWSRTFHWMRSKIGLKDEGSKFDLSKTRVKADQGDAEAQFALGLNYGSAEGKLENLVQAAEWYRKAADQNHSLAQFNLGLMYFKGDGVPRDAAAAVSWMRRAANQGDAGAQFNLGMRCHRASLGGLQLDPLESKVEAYKWLRLAATQGYRGSAEACESVTLAMNREEVAEGNRRAAAFVAGSPPDLGPG